MLTIGNFDGVHRGHQALLSHLAQEGKRLGLPSVVMIFEPQPLEFFAPDKAPARLTRLRDKVKYLAQYGVDYLLCVKFSKQFASLTPDAFISHLLVEQLGVKFLVVGDDFRFGKIVRAILTGCVRQGNSMVSRSAARKVFVITANGSAARPSAVRWKMTIWHWLRHCSGTLTASAGAWCTATNSGARSVSRLPISP
ncbi:Riboflavin kinase / FMN adenylyltransferase [Morganella morganii IS15]|nr:Riboflavin kinase / FMN adenylyltransferase [Morganella morganii IS15]